MEQWRPVVGYEGLYEVSDQGSVRSLTRRTGVNRPRIVQGRVLKLNSSDRYYTISLSKDGSGRRYYVHFLVLEAFTGPRPEGLEARHLNGDMFDNRAENLEWSDHATNMRDQLLHGTNARARKTECSRGHPFKSWNLMDRGAGIRGCRACSYAGYRKYQVKVSSGTLWTDEQTTAYAHEAFARLKVKANAADI